MFDSVHKRRLTRFMPYRTFADDQGKSWEIWDVRPERVERRRAERRQERPTPWLGAERRVAADRRRRDGTDNRSEHPLVGGWLVFKSDDEKRRLAPIPPNWASRRGQELRELWEKADIIARRIDERSA